MVRCGTCQHAARGPDRLRNKGIERSKHDLQPPVFRACWAPAVSMRLAPPLKARNGRAPRWAMRPVENKLFIIAEEVRKANFQKGFFHISSHELKQTKKNRLSDEVARRVTGQGGGRGRRGKGKKVNGDAICRRN